MRIRSAEASTDPSQSVAVVERGGHGLYGEVVAVLAESGDRAGRHGCDDTDVAPRLAGVGVGDVDLDLRTFEGRQRVMDRPGVVREGAGVDDDRRAPTAG